MTKVSSQDVEKVRKGITEPTSLFLNHMLS